MEARIFQSTEVDDGHLNVVAYIYIYIEQMKVCCVKKKGVEGSL